MWIKAEKKRIKGLKGKEVLGMQMEGIFPLSATLPVEKMGKKKDFDKLFKKFMRFPELCLFILFPRDKLLEYSIPFVSKA